MITLYTLPHCPNCEEAKRRLKMVEKPFIMRDMSDSAAVAELRVNGCFLMEAPIIQIGDSFYSFEEFFSD